MFPVQLVHSLTDTVARREFAAGGKKLLYLIFLIFLPSHLSVEIWSFDWIGLHLNLKGNLFYSQKGHVDDD